MFLTKTDARAWMAGTHAKFARGEWEPSAVAYLEPEFGDTPVVCEYRRVPGPIPART